MSADFAVSVFTNCHKQPLSKRVKLDSDKRIVKQTCAQLTEGVVEQKVFKSIESFCDFMANLEPYKAVSFGLSKHVKIKILSQSKAKNFNGDEEFITRTRDHFLWSSNAGVLFLDYDPVPGTDALEPDDLIKTLRQAVPELKSTVMALKPSASSCIYNKDTEIQGVRGQHVFVLCDKASNIPMIGKLIFNRLWLAGHGYIHVSESGHMLERTIIDASVWQPERLIFGRAHCDGGIQQNFPKPFIFYPEN